MKSCYRIQNDMSCSLTLISGGRLVYSATCQLLNTCSIPTTGDSHNLTQADPANASLKNKWLPYIAKPRCYDEYTSMTATKDTAFVFCYKGRIVVIANAHTKHNDAHLTLAQLSVSGMRFFYCRVLIDRDTFRLLLSYFVILALNRYKITVTYDVFAFVDSRQQI